MTTQEAIAQLQSLIEDAENHRESDGSLDGVFQDDIKALKMGIEALTEKQCSNCAEQESKRMFIDEIMTCLGYYKNDGDCRPLTDNEIKVLRAAAHILTEVDHE